MRLIRMLVLAALAVAGIQAHADDAATQRLSAMLSKAQTLSARFSQLTLDGSGTRLQETAGNLALKRPGLFRWEVKKPSPQLVVTTGKTLWIYDPELMQATRQKLDQQVGNTPALLLSGDPRQLESAFAISEADGQGGDQVFVLEPRGKDALFESLRVHFDAGKLTEMELTDTLSQHTDIRFSNIRQNPALPASVFTFVPPKGVDVIDQF